MVPTPPVNETPPSTHAEMTCSSKPCAVVGWPLVIRASEDDSRETAIRPCSVKMMIFGFCDSDARQPRGFRVAADGERVAPEDRLVQQQTIDKETKAMIQTGVGMPANCEMPSA